MGGSGCAIEDLEAIDIGCLVSDRRHPIFTFAFLTLGSITAGSQAPCGFASTGRYKADCVADYVNDRCWSGDAGRVIHSMRLYLCLHSLRHVALRCGYDHSVVFTNQKPTGDVLPKGASDRNSDAAQGSRPLDGSEHCQILPGSVLRECRLECFLR